MSLTLTSLLRIYGQPQNFGTKTGGCCILMVLFPPCLLLICLLLLPLFMSLISIKINYLLRLVCFPWVLNTQDCYHCYSRESHGYFVNADVNFLSQPHSFLHQIRVCLLMSSPIIMGSLPSLLLLFQYLYLLHRLLW